MIFPEFALLQQGLTMPECSQLHAGAFSPILSVTQPSPFSSNAKAFPLSQPLPNWQQLLSEQVGTYSSHFQAKCCKLLLPGAASNPPVEAGETPKDDIWDQEESKAKEEWFQEVDSALERRNFWALTPALNGVSAFCM